MEICYLNTSLRGFFFPDMNILFYIYDFKIDALISK